MSGDSSGWMIGQYEVIREIGRGGMAVVYLARQPRLDRLLVLKELAARHSADASFAERFLREAMLSASLSHPNIVTVHDYFENEGVAYITMEYLERGSLRPYIGHLTLAQVLGALDDVLAGLTHANERGIVHRDLKPENLMISSGGRVKIADFGIAKAFDRAASSNLTLTGTTVGTPAYMAPEQAMGQQIGPHTDLYSLGIIAYEMLAGRVPFEGSETPLSILMRHVNEPVPPLLDANPAIDSELVTLVDNMLQKNVEARIQQPSEAGERLDEIALRLLGPRWRRNAVIGEPSLAGTTSPSLATPDPPPVAPVEARISPPETAEPPTVEPMRPPTPASREPSVAVAPPTVDRLTTPETVPTATAAGRLRTRWIGLALLLAGLAAVGVAVWSLSNDTHGDSASSAPAGAHQPLGRQTSTEYIRGDFRAVTEDASSLIAAGPDRVIQIDPQTNEQVDGILVDGRPIGLTADAKDIWTVIRIGRSSNLVRVDPKGLAVKSTVRILGVPANGAPALGFGSVWIPTSSGVLRYSVPAKAFLPVPSLGVDAVRDISFSSGKLWVSGRDGGVGKVVGFDAAKNRVVVTGSVGDPAGIAARADGVWVAERSQRQLLKLDARTGKVVSRVGVGRGTPEWVAVRDTPVWVLTRLSGNAGRIVFVDPATSRQTGTPVDVRISRRTPEPALQFHSLWVLGNTDEHGIVRVGLSPEP